MELIISGPVTINENPRDIRNPCSPNLIHNKTAKAYGDSYSLFTEGAKRLMKNHFIPVGDKRNDAHELAFKTTIANVGKVHACQNVELGT